MDYTITLTDAEDKALRFVAVDPQAWIENAAKARCAAAADEIVKQEIDRMMADPEVTAIPARREEIVALADLKSAAVREAEFVAMMQSRIRPLPAKAPIGKTVGKAGL